MTSETSQLRALFEAALSVPPGDRSAWLDRHCADSGLRTRVEQLLAADASAEDRLGETSADMLAQIMADEREDDEGYRWTPGAWVGPFELLEILGEGGSSTVYRAQRNLDGIVQSVALKVLHRGIHTADAQRRFRRERTALAQLRHPGIARMIEGGVTAEGHGYIAMELVDGVSITHHVRDHRIDLRGRLRLFLQVCSAVAAAHRALIVHRDLKPANVMVTTDGEVKLLDFGIAKLLAADDTRTVIPAFTPAYAAPEQRIGAEVTTATDVYALGVLLGELVTGKRMDGGSGKTPSREVPDLAPAGILPASPTATRRMLRGDLDTMLLKAINPDPEQRYVSADALAEDVRNLLAGRPVNAHAPGGWYRTRKFLARHKAVVGTATVLALAILAALGMALWQAKLARHQAQRADSVRDFLLEVFDSAKPAGPRLAPPSVTDVVRASVTQAQRSTRLEPGVRVELISTLGTVLRSQGDMIDSIALLESNYRDAINGIGLEDEATLQSGLALANAYAAAGRLSPARETADSLLRHDRRAAADLRARMLALSADISSNQFEPQRALAESAAAVRLCQSEGCRKQTESLVLLVRGNALAEFHDDKAAIDAFERALAVQKQLYAGPHIEVAETLQLISRAERRLSRLDRAERLAREALVTVDASVPDPHQLRAEARDALRQVLIDSHQFDEAIDLGKQVIAINIATLGPQHGRLATSYNTLGFTYFARGNYAQAEVQYRAALAISESIENNERRSAIYRSNLGEAIGLGGDADAGVHLIQQAIQSLRNQQEPDYSEICSSLEKLGRLQREQGRLADAEASYRQADAIYAQHLQTAPKDWRAVTLVGLGRTLADSGNLVEASRVLREALALEMKPADALSNSRIEAKAALAEVLIKENQAVAARAMLQEAKTEAARDRFLRPYLARQLNQVSRLIEPPMPHPGMS